MSYPDNLLPVMQCDRGCGKCCGPVACTTHEYERVMDYAAEHNVTPQRNGMGTCPWYQDGTCSVYEARPMVCRLFGHVPSLVCPHGYNRNIDEKTERRISEPYARMVDRDVRLLHEAAYSFEEMKEILKGGAP